MATAVKTAARLASRTTAASKTAASISATRQQIQQQLQNSPTYFRITLRRSAIGLPYKIGRTLAALGLRKRMRTVFHPVTRDVAGQILMVKELVAVQEVSAEEVMTRSQLREARKPAPGFWLERPFDGGGGDADGAR